MSHTRVLTYPPVEALKQVSTNRIIAGAKSATLAPSVNAAFGLLGTLRELGDRYPPTRTGRCD